MNSLMMLSIASLFYITILAITFFIKKPIKSKETKIYSILIIVLLIEIICELIMRILGSHINELYSLNIIVSKIFNILIVAWLTIITLYNLNISTSEEKYNKYKKYLYVFLVLSSILIALLPIEFNIVESGNYYSYTFGPSVKMVYASLTILMIINVILILLNYKKLQKKYIPIIIAIILLIITGIIQSQYPEILLNLFAQALVTFIMYNTIENPDAKMIKELEYAKDQAIKANNAKTEFLSSMSHEIRTPLNAISGFSDCILESNSLEEAKDNAKDIVKASDTLIEIVNGILDISKLEAGKIEIENNPYNSKETFEEPAKLIETKAKEKNLDFSYSIDENIPKVLNGDSLNIKKIITNLLSNAIKYTNNGSIKYEIHCENKDDLSKLTITVEDTGKGIKEEDIDKLFNKFERLEDNKNPSIEGTGLGLAITKELVEMMKGKLEVESKYNEGSKFTVIISQKIEKEEIKKEEKHLDNLDLKDIKILLVDDNELNIKVTNKLLEKYNANNITSVYSGFECIEEVKNNKYDLILLDDMMPKMTGIETLHKLQKLDNFNIPVIALTANAITGMKENYINEGFTNYLSKPIEKEQLINVLNEIIKTNNIEVQEEDKVIEVPIDLINNKEENEHVIEFENIEEPVIDGVEYLKSMNVDIDKSLELLGDIDMFNSTVEEFLNTVEEKWQKIEMYKLDNNMKDYAIEVHSLKSDAKYLGLTKLAEIAYEHELSSKEEKTDYVNDNFITLEEEYQNALNILNNYQDIIKK